MPLTRLADVELSGTARHPAGPETPAPRPTLHSLMAALMRTCGRTNPEPSVQHHEVLIKRQEVNVGTNSKSTRRTEAHSQRRRLARPRATRGVGRRHG